MDSTENLVERALCQSESDSEGLCLASVERTVGSTVLWEQMTGGNRIQDLEWSTSTDGVDMKYNGEGTELDVNVCNLHPVIML